MAWCLGRGAGLSLFQRHHKLHKESVTRRRPLSGFTTSAQVALRDASNQR